MKIFGLTTLILVALVATSVRADEDVDEEVGAEDEAVEEDDEGVVEEDEGGEIGDMGEELMDEMDLEEPDAEGSTGATEVDIHQYFPDSTITAGKISELLVSFKVNEDAVDDYVIGMIEGGFHYPQDWSYKVQNFSAIRYSRKLTAGQEATFMYPFMPAELAGGRSYGLQLNIHYHANAEPPRAYSEALFNKTIEVSENLDNAAAEQFFMFLTLLALGGIAAAFFLKQFSTKKKPVTVVEVGTTGKFDESWIPKGHLKSTENVSPSTSPKTRHRKKN
jgi:translocon-associated protein subunit alpha